MHIGRGANRITLPFYKNIFGYHYGKTMYK